MKLFFSRIAQKLRFLKFGEKGKFILLFLNGFFLSLLFYCYIENEYESELFSALANNVRAQINTLPDHSTEKTDSILVKSLRLVHHLETSRESVFKNFEVNAFKSRVITPVSYDLMTGKQACGGFSYVLGRLLQEFDIEIRFAQMKVNGFYGGHILIEAETPNGWVVLDPSFDVSFKRPDGNFASFADVQGNWSYYKEQVPANYVMRYQYDDVRYTNWDKIPVILPLTRSILSLFIGDEKAQNYSFRPLVLSKYKVIFNITLVIYLFILYRTIRGFIRQRRLNARNEVPPAT